MVKVDEVVLVLLWEGTPQNSQLARNVSWAAVRSAILVLLVPIFSLFQSEQTVDTVSHRCGKR